MSRWTDLFRRLPLFSTTSEPGVTPVLELAPAELDEDRRVIAQIASRLSWVDFDEGSARPTRRALHDLIATSAILAHNPQIALFIRGRYPEEPDSDFGRMMGLRRAHAVEAVLMRNGASAHQVRTHSMALPEDPAERVVQGQHGRVVFRVRRSKPRDRAA